jgi:hypothetical protein
MNYKKNVSVELCHNADSPRYILLKSIQISFFFAFYYAGDSDDLSFWQLSPSQKGLLVVNLQPQSVISLTGS